MVSGQVAQAPPPVGLQASTEVVVVIPVALQPVCVLVHVVTQSAVNELPSAV